MPGKYDILEDATGWQLGILPVTPTPPIVVPKPRNVMAIPKPIAVAGITSYTLELRWDFPVTDTGDRQPFITSYYVEFARDGGSYGSRQEVPEGQRSAIWENVGAGSFQGRVAAAVAANGKISAWEYSLSPGSFFPVQAIADYTDPDHAFWFE